MSALWSIIPFADVNHTEIGGGFDVAGGVYFPSDCIGIQYGLHAFSAN